MFRIADVEEQAEARARTAGESNRRIDRDVVTLIRTRGRRWRLIAASPSALRALTALPAARGSRRFAIALILRGGGTGSPWKTRGELTMAALAGAPSGTLITSRRNRAVFGSSMPPSWHPGTSSADRTPAVPDT
jgi:hypothetical protein